MIAKLSVTGCHRSHGAWMIIKKVTGNVVVFVCRVGSNLFMRPCSIQVQVSLFDKFYSCEITQHRSINGLENDLFQKAWVKI